MITGELVYTNSEFQIDIQDINFISASVSNIETSADISSSYSWSATNQASGRITAQAMANTSQENADTKQDELTNVSDNDESPTNTLQEDDERLDSVEEDSNSTSQNRRSKRKRTSRK